MCFIEFAAVPSLTVCNISFSGLYIINDVEPEIFQKNALEALNEGYNIVIFPTGTRTLPGEDIKIHKGAAQLAIISGANIVPINIKTDFPFLRKHHSPLDAGEKTVNYYLKILPEIDTKDYNIDTVGEIKARNHISAKIKECINNGKLIPDKLAMQIFEDKIVKYNY